MLRLQLIVFLAALSIGAPAVAEQYDREAALAISQDALGRSLGKIALRDTDGQSFELATLYDRPVVVSLIYTSCHHVCPLITKNLADTVDIAREALGDDSFSVVTIGFDWAVDTPDRMRTYAIEQGVDDSGWYFLAGDDASIEALTSTLGFQYYPSAKGFDHLSQTSVLGTGGRLYRQLYGVTFEPPTLVEPLKEIIFDTPRDAGFVDHWVDTFKLFCTVFDPNSGRYRFDYSIFTAIITGILCLGAVGFFIAREWRTAR